MKCHSEQCNADFDKEISFAVCWPGKDEPLRMCYKCSEKAKAVADILGYPIVVLPWLRGEKATEVLGTST